MHCTKAAKSQQRTKRSSWEELWTRGETPESAFLGERARPHQYEKIFADLAGKSLQEPPPDALSVSWANAPCGSSEGEIRNTRASREPAEPSIRYARKLHAHSTRHAYGGVPQELFPSEPSL